MPFHPLKIAVNPDAWRLFAIRKNKASFLPIRDKVLVRDQQTCQFCGFQADAYQEIVNLDNDYYNNKFANLITACCFCAQCLFIDSINNNDYGGGTLIYCPEISQPELNSLCHVLFCAIANNTDYRDVAQSIYRTLSLRAQIVETQLGDGTSDPANLGRLIIESQANDHDNTIDFSQLLKNLRLLPSRAKFKVQIEHWAAAALSELSSIQ